MCSPAGRYHHQGITFAGARPWTILKCSESLEGIRSGKAQSAIVSLARWADNFGSGRRPKKPRRSGAAKWEETPSQRDHHSLAESSRCVQIDFLYFASERGGPMTAKSLPFEEGRTDRSSATGSIDNSPGGILPPLGIRAFEAH
jgi:hypothetical protein